MKVMETRAENPRAPRIAIAANTLLIPSPSLVLHWQCFEQTALIGFDVRAGTLKLAGQDECEWFIGQSRSPSLILGF